MEQSQQNVDFCQNDKSTQVLSGHNFQWFAYEEQNQIKPFSMIFLKMIIYTKTGLLERFLLLNSLIYFIFNKNLISKCDISLSALKQVQKNG